MKNYDYSSPGAYFVTTCTQDRHLSLGSVENGRMNLSRFGETAAEWWQWLERQYPWITLDQWVVMPNHLHGIIIIRRGDSRTAPAPTYTDKDKNAITRVKPLGQLVGAFKTVSTKRINQMRNMPGATFWQRNYYEHVIRDETSLNRIREYIQTNPMRWELDKENADRTGEDEFDQWLASPNGRGESRLAPTRTAPTAANKDGG